jgi:hypothetical protein
MEHAVIAFLGGVQQQHLPAAMAAAALSSWPAAGLDLT